MTLGLRWEWRTRQDKQQGEMGADYTTLFNLKIKHADRIKRAGAEVDLPQWAALQGFPSLV